MIMIPDKIPMRVYLTCTKDVDADVANDLLNRRLKDVIDAIRNQTATGRPPWATIVEDNLLVMVAEGEYGEDAMKHFLGKDKKVESDCDYYALAVLAASKQGQGIISTLSKHPLTIKKVIP